ncbi:SH3 domain-containing protein [Lineolata rhizophorae]|uniref:SH3 domain-containing protein n=1 Tax=Lineolata rhizophorae TaxID=578093 RepID=A0A6A6P4S1_9PEZI|nr:SH3 domain-containing protein [Lineolata rhizophorae]
MTIRHRAGNDDNMGAHDELSQAMAKKSLQNVKTELEFLGNINAISPAQLSQVMEILRDTPLAASINASVTTGMSNLAVSTPSSDEKKTGYYADNATGHAAAAIAPPPAYGAPSPVAPPAGPPPLARATALYAYNAADAGDLALAPHDRIAVTEYMNAEWWKGRNERSGAEGIFPRAYVRVEEKGVASSGSLSPMPAPTPYVPPGQQQGTNYGNVPLEVSQSGGSHGGPHAPSKTEEYGKKFGKKMGNAAIFGAGATVGSKIVNGIF